jgi:hypothetical protein
MRAFKRDAHCALHRSGKRNPIDDKTTNAAFDSRTNRSRSRIRQVFERRFSSHAMAQRYLELYRKLLRQRHHDPVPVAAAAGGRAHGASLTTGAASGLGAGAAGFRMSAGA